jgi:soluble lytic murein transglycosylase
MLALVPATAAWSQTAAPAENKAAPQSSTKPGAADSKPDAKSAAKDEKKSEKKSGTKTAKKPDNKPDNKASDTKADSKKPEKNSETKAAAKSTTTKPATKPTDKPTDKSAKTASDKAHPKAASAPPSRIATPLMPAASAGSAERGMPNATLAYAPPATSGGLPLAAAATTSTAPTDMDAVKQALGFVHSSRIGEATAVERGIADPLARKLVEWVILRNDDNDADFARYSAFISANPSWPSIVTLRRRAEAMLWQERAPSATVRAYFAGARPLSPKGRFALARALLADGDRAGAQAYVREAWRNDAFSHEIESQALDLFGDLITRADDKARMDERLYFADDGDAGLRAAKRLGGDEPAIAKARIAVNAKAGNAKTLLDEVPHAARRDAGYIFSSVQWLRRRDKIAEAGALMLTAPRDAAQTQDVDEWWVERRLVARKLLDIGDAKTAYAVVREAAPPTRDNYRAEQQFTAGWIALRFLHEPRLAAQHFARIAEGNSNPISIARAGYWLGRAEEAANRPQEARAHYELAARYTTAYYGQLARARLGHGEIAFAPPPALPAERRQALARLEVVRAAEILYALDERGLVAPLVADLADKSFDQGALAVLAEIAESHGDARAVLLIGKIALGRGFPFDQYAFPLGGLPRYSAIGPEVEPAVVYAIARQESAFNPATVSSAKALGLMQVTPEAGRYIAKKFGVAFDQHRLLHDTVYNTQMGAAELGDDIERYRGSYILAFAGYNAGAGRVKEWVERYGDPRDPRVDPIDWVERIPFSETRNYVQRILENLQVYRVRFGGGTRLMIEADIRRGLQAD